MLRQGPSGRNRDPDAYEAGDAASHGAVIEIAAEAFRNLFSRANAFINSDGDMETAAYDKIELQAAIDRIIAL